MTEETNMPPEGRKNKKGMCGGHGAASGLYGLGFVGALVYYIQHAGSFTDGLVGALKALVWPAMVVYKLLEFMKM